MTNRPTLLNSCAFAATAAEAKFRIDGKPQAARAVSVVALDRRAAGVIQPLVDRPWLGARFLTLDDSAQAVPAQNGTRSADLVIRRHGGAQVRLSETLQETDFLLMIATADAGAAAAAVIGNACALRGIMTAAIVLGSETKDAVSAVRPYARVLLVTKDEQDIAELMSAVGA